MLGVDPSRRPRPLILMKWIALSEKDASTERLEDRLWAAADQLRANSGLTSAQYSLPVRGLIFLRFAEVRFLAKRAVLEKQARGGSAGHAAEVARAAACRRNRTALT